MVVCSSTLFSQVEEYNDLVLSFDNETIKLEKDLAYYYLTASNDFLARFEGYTKQIYFQNLSGGEITRLNKLLYGKGANRDGIYFKIDFDNDKIAFLENSLSQQQIIDLPKNPFRFERPFLANSEDLISVRTYEPSMFVFDLEGELNDFEYDETKIEAEYVFNDFGRATNPLSRVNMKLNDATLKTNSNIIYLAREGYTEKYPENNRAFSINTITLKENT